jgi:cytochrome c-type biogenesis protein CcmH
MLADPALEARAREVSKELRCLVCQNQSIDDSDAGLARDLRILVRERLQAGDSNREVIDFVVARYGDFVLLKPPLKVKTYGLWFGPAAVFVVAIVAVSVFFFRRRRKAQARLAPEPLSPEERRRLDALLRDDVPE